MKKFKLTKVFGGENKTLGTFNTKPEAAKSMEEIIDAHNYD